MRVKVINTGGSRESSSLPLLVHSCDLDSPASLQIIDIFPTAFKGRGWEKKESYRPLNRVPFNESAHTEAAQRQRGREEKSWKNTEFQVVGGWAGKNMKD